MTSLVLGAVFAIALVVSLIATPAAIALARRWGFMAVPGQVKHIHRIPVPRLGGLPLFLGFMFAVAFALWTSPLVTPPAGPDPREPTRLVGLILGATVAFALGVLDDRVELSPNPQFLGQFLAAGIAVYFGIRIDAIANPLGGDMLFFPLWLSVPLTFFWIVLAMNTINWLDGLDGLAAGIGAFAAILLFLRSVTMIQPQYSIAMLLLALAGSSLGLLPFNFHPARIFLAGGAYLLGFLLGALSIIGGTKGATFLLVLSIPILDLAWQILNRVLHGRSPVRGDRGHLHHRLFDLGISQPRVVFAYYAFSAFLGSLALVLPRPLEKYLALAASAVLALAVMVYLAQTRVRPD